MAPSITEGSGGYRCPIHGGRGDDYEDYEASLYDPYQDGPSFLTETRRTQGYPGAYGGPHGNVMPSDLSGLSLYDDATRASVRDGLCSHHRQLYDQMEGANDPRRAAYDNRPNMRPNQRGPQQGARELIANYLAGAGFERPDYRSGRPMQMPPHGGRESHRQGGARDSRQEQEDRYFAGLPRIEDRIEEVVDDASFSGAPFAAGRGPPRSRRPPGRGASMESEY